MNEVVILFINVVEAAPMRMSQKLILLFSLLAILTTAANSIYFYNLRVADLDKRTYENLNALGTKILSEIEQYVQLMDYAIDSLTADVDFMNSLHAASLLDDTSDLGEQLAVQNILSRTLYQQPILENFYRVSVYARNGFLMSSRFEKTNSIASMSDDAKDIVNSLDYLVKVDQKPFHRLLVGPHRDPWTSPGEVIVFSAVRSVAWHGSQSGYIEVNAYLDELAEIFMLNKIEGFLAQGIFDNGEQLFRFHGDDVVYSNLIPDNMTRVRLENGSERLVVGLYSDSLHMSVYVSQDMSVYNRQAKELLMNYVTAAIIILLITLFFVAVFSLSLTRSIRKLTKRVRHLPVDSLLAHLDGTLNVTVTTRRDQEIYQLEQMFNNLMNRLHASMQNEIIMREGALQAHLNALQMQINPHFIYNTLNIISAKSMECGNEEIIDICDQFAQMLRYATDLRSKTATLGEELQNAKRYLMLAKARYEDQLEYTINVPPEMESLLVPKLSLQPIIENALTHGFSGRTDKRVVQLIGSLEKDMLHLIIRDNGNGFNHEALTRLREAFRKIEQETMQESSAVGEHFGLINTYLRLHHYSQGRIRMRLYNDCGAVIVLTLSREQEGKHV